MGIDEKFVDSDRLSRHAMVRKEFCWMTEPLAPRLEARDGKSITMVWDPVQCCGVDQSLVSGNITYCLEVNQGHQWVPGGVHQFAEGTESGTFRLMGKGVGLTRLRVDDLKPAQWYHWRVRVDYLGSSVVSPARAVPSNRYVHKPQREPYPSL